MKNSIIIYYKDKSAAFYMRNFRKIVKEQFPEHAFYYEKADFNSITATDNLGKTDFLLALNVQSMWIGLLTDLLQNKVV